jgi:hypothetical protein
MSENLIHRLLPHQGCVITRTPDGVNIAGSAMGPLCDPLAPLHSARSETLSRTD